MFRFLPMPFMVLHLPYGEDTVQSSGRICFLGAPHHAAINLPFNSCRSTGFGAVVLLVGGLWLNRRRIIWKSHIFCVLFHLFHGFIWSLILCGIHVDQWNWLHSYHCHHQELSLSSSRRSKDIHCISCISSLCLLRPFLYPSSIHTEHIPNEEIMVWCWSIALKPPPLTDNWANFAFRRFLAFLEGPVWLRSIALQPWEGPFCPKMCSNLDSANGQSVVGAIR